MIIGKALAAWLADLEARNSTVAGLEETRRRLRAQPAYAELEREVEAETSGDAAALLAPARRFLSDDQALEKSMAILVEAAQGDPFFRPPMRSPSTRFSGVDAVRPAPTCRSIFPCQRHMIAEKRLRRRGGLDSFHGQPLYLPLPESGGAIVSVWEASAIDPVRAATGPLPAPRAAGAQRRRISGADGSRTVSFDLPRGHSLPPASTPRGRLRSCRIWPIRGVCRREKRDE